MVKEKIRRITLPIRLQRSSSGGDINVYLIGDKDLTLIDTGTVFAFDDLEREINVAGKTFGDLKKIIITHSHSDHFGLAKRLKEKTKAQIYAYIDDAHRIEKFYEDIDRRNLFMERLLKMSGFDKEVINNSMSIFSILKILAEPVEVDFGLNNGDKIEISSIQLKVIHTPGHHPYAMCLYSEENKFLFSGDNILRRIKPTPSIYFENSGQRIKQLPLFINSLKEIKELKLNWIYPAHGKEIKKPKKTIDLILSYFEKGAEKVYEFIQKPKMPREIYKFLFPNLKVILPQRIGFVFGYLDLLEERSLINSFEDKGVIFYERN